MDQSTYNKELLKYSKAPKTIQTSYSFYQLMKMINDAVNISINQRLEGLEIVHQEVKDKLLTLDEVAQLFQCSKASVHNYKKDGRLKGFMKIGNRTYIKESDCLASLREIGFESK